MSEAFSPNVDSLEPTFKRAAIVWWSFFWRALFFGSILLFLIGALLTTIGSIAGISHDTMGKLVMIVAFIVNVPISIFAVQIALGVRYSEFTICLSPTGENHQIKRALPDLIP